MSAPQLVPVTVGTGRAALDLLGPLAAALDGMGPALLPHAAGDPAPVSVGVSPGDLPAGLALAVGTSGSTGSPKRALLTAASLTVSAAATHTALGGPGGWVLALPATHIAGVQVLVRSLLAGTTPVAVESEGGFTPAAFAAAVGSLRAPRRYAALVPTQVHLLLSDPAGAAALAGLDAVLVGGAAIASPLLQRAAEAGARVVRSYGMSETAGGCVYDGTPLPCTRVRTERGRILVGGATLAYGYLADPAATTAAFVVDGSSERWFRTDDVGHLDAAAVLHVDGRVDDMITTGGLKVAPGPVEDAIAARRPEILDVVVVATPDPMWGEAVTAVVRTRPGHRPPSVRELRAELRGILADHALPRRVVTLADIPSRGPGKPDRAAVRRLVAPEP